MKKFILVLSILVLIVFTTLTKNSTKKLENEIFITQENISVLKYKYENVFFEYNFFTTPQKLMEYQSKYFENYLIPIDINEIKQLERKKNQFIISKFKKK